MVFRSASPVGPLPNFLLIGAMKAGTTSLYHYLRSHPQVFMPSFKAPEFFAGKAHTKRGIDWYRNQFAGAGAEAVAIGEASNVYTKFPHYPGVPERIAEQIPDVKLLYIVRDPVERIRSHYQTRVAEGAEKASFGSAVLENPIYLDYSRYWLQIEQYLACFSDEQLLVTTAEQLRHDRASLLRRVYTFLGVDADFVPPDIDREFYRTQEKPVRSVVPLQVRKSLKRHFPSTKRLKELEANTVRQLDRLRGRSGVERPAAAFVVTDEVRAAIGSALVEDVKQLRRVLGPDFDGWGIA